MHGYTTEQEEVLREFADKAQCFRWLHDHARMKYSILYLSFQVPIICFTTVAGMLAVFGQAYPEYNEILMILVAVTNITCALCNTLSSFLKLAELQEAHRMATLAWGKFARNIRITLSLERHRRPAAQGYIDRCKDELDRLSEFSPNIPESVRKLFMIEVDHKEPLLVLPELVGELRPTPVTRPKVEDCEAQTDRLSDKHHEPEKPRKTQK